MICAEMPDVETVKSEERSVPPRAQPQLRIFARDHDTRIRFIADGLPVAVGRVAETVAFDTIEEAAAVAAACAALLQISKGCQVDAEGWHQVPTSPDGTHQRLTIVLPNLLRAARGMIWTGADPDPPPLAPDPLGPLLEAPESRARGPEDGGAGNNPARPWTRQRDARLCYLVGQGWSAKMIATDPEIHSTELAVYKRVSRLGLSFAESPMGQINFRIPRGHLVVIDRAAAAAGQTRNAFMRGWTMRAVTKPDRYGLVAIPA